MVANIDTMAWTGETPWHREGTQVDHLMSSEEALKLAKCDWTVAKTPLTYMFGDDTMTVPESYGIVRQDTGDCIGVVGERYLPKQNAEVFQFVDDVCATKLARIEVCGSLGRGEKVWVLAKITGEYRIGQTDDVIEPYLLIGNGHDGKMPFFGMFTSIRVVCQNTFNIAVSGKADAIANNKYFSVRHTQSMENRAEEAIKTLNLSMKRFEMYTEIATAMASRKLSGDEIRSYFNKVAPIPPVKVEGKERKSRNQDVQDNLISLFESGHGNQLEGIRGSLWGGFNAVTEFVDHNRTIRNTESNSVVAMSQFYSGSTMKDIAWNTACEMLQAA